VNLRFVEAFIEVAREQSITKAAKNLNLTQAAISSRIATLQKELGVTLVDRRDRVFYLTEAGERFLDYAKRFSALQEDLQRELCASRRGPLPLRIGSIETVLHTWLVPLLERLEQLRREKRQPIEFELNVEMSAVLDKRLRQGSLDLIFSAAPTVGEDFVNEALPPMEMVFIGPATLAGAAALSIDDLLARELLTFQRGSQPHAALLKSLRAHHAADKRVHTFSSILAMVKLVESGFGLATLPKAVADDLARGGHAIAILESELKLTPLPLYASYWNQPAALALKKAIADALAFTREAVRPKPSEHPAAHEIG